MGHASQDGLWLGPWGSLRVSVIVFGSCNVTYAYATFNPNLVVELKIYSDRIFDGALPAPMPPDRKEFDNYSPISRRHGSLGSNDAAIASPRSAAMAVKDRETIAGVV